MVNRKPEELQRRIVIAKVILIMLNKDPELLNDMRQPEAIRHYNAQLLKLETELYSIIEPQPVVVGLQPERLAAKSENTKEQT